MSKTINLSEQDVIGLLEEWSSISGVTLEPTNRQGASNTTYIINSPAGKFILKLYGDSTLTTQIQYEHSLLAYLQQVDLSFAVPAPLQALSGETLVWSNRNDTPLRVALLPFLPGQPAERQNLRHTRAAGQALGELHRTLAGFDPKGQLAQLPSWGDLYHIHPLVADPLEVTQLLGLTSNQEAHLIKTLTEVISASPYLYKTLPVQTIHADYLSANILLEDDQVVGILDFEFATIDLQLMDYICGLDHFTSFPWQELPRWEFIQAFSAGYRENILLTPLEVEAITTAWRLQWASSIVYWTGWLREGKGSQQSALDAVAKLLLLEEWFEDKATALLNCLTGSEIDCYQ